MSEALTDKELGVVQAVLERYNQQWLPAILEMRAKVDRGDVLDEQETKLLKKAIDEAKGGTVFAQRHPEFQTLIDKATRLYDHIVAKNSENAESV